MTAARLPQNALSQDLLALRDAWDDAGIASVTTIGDALAPGTIAAAVFSGRRCAEEMDGAALVVAAAEFLMKWASSRIT